MTLDPTFLRQLVLIAFGVGAALIAALWLSLVFWTGRDIRSRTSNGFVRFLSVLLVLLLFLPGLLLYLILRPAHTLESDYQRALEEEALLQTIEDADKCPGCTRRVEKEWIVCPGCHVKLKKTCPQCENTLELAWELCPFCASPVPNAVNTESFAQTRPSVSINDGEKSNEQAVKNS